MEHVSSQETLISCRILSRKKLGLEGSCNRDLKHSKSSLAHQTNLKKKLIGLLGGAAEDKSKFKILGIYSRNPFSGKVSGTVNT